MSSATPDERLAREYAREAEEAGRYADEQRAISERLEDEAGESTEASGYYARRAAWAEYIESNRRESAEYFGGGF